MVIQGLVLDSVADPDDFWPDPDPTFENVRIRILSLNFGQLFQENFVDENMH
jgi:hypothetical protein